MNQRYCSSCGKPNKYYKHPGSYKHHDLHHCHCHDAIYENKSGGIANGFSSRLTQLIGYPVVMHVDYGSGSEKILAEICHVDYNYVEVKLIKKMNATLGEEEIEDNLYKNELEVELANLLEETEMIEEEIDNIQAELALVDNEDDNNKVLKVNEKKFKSNNKKKRHKKHYTNRYAIYSLESLKWVEYNDYEEYDDQ